MQNIHELKGQKIARTLLDAYLKGSVPPLIILHGPEGSGKWSAAEAFIQQKLCEVGTGCGSCARCRQITKGEYPDLIQFPAEQILIGDPEHPASFTIRWLLRTRLPYSPFSGELRFVLFPRADLIRDEAETALLKTLEEPADHTRFIFICESLDDLKETIISRGVSIPFRRLSFKEQKEVRDVPEELQELMGGTFALLPFFHTKLFEAMQEKIEEGLNHPLGLLRLERWLESGERKAFADLLGEESISYAEILDTFGLLLMKAAEGRTDHASIVHAILDFKEGLHREQSGLHHYLIGLLFHRLNRILFTST